MTWTAGTVPSRRPCDQRLPGAVAAEGRRVDSRADARADRAHVVVQRCRTPSADIEMQVQARDQQRLRRLGRTVGTLVAADIDNAPPLTAHSYTAAGALLADVAIPADRARAD